MVTTMLGSRDMMMKMTAMNPSPQRTRETDRENNKIRKSPFSNN